MLKKRWKIKYISDEYCDKNRLLKNFLKSNNTLMGECKMKIIKPEWLSLSKEIKVKLIRLAILENQRRYSSQ